MLWSFSQTSQNPNPQSQITDHGSQITQRRSQIRTGVSSLALSALLAAVTGLILCGLYASQSRGAWIGAAASVIVVSAVRSKRAAVLFATVVTLLAIVGATGAFDLLPESVVQRFADVIPVTGIPNIAIAEVTDANFPAIERLAHWQSALNMWRDHLWLGVGFGNYPAVYPVYAIGRWLDPLGHAHNFYLNVAAETGLAGLLAYGLFWLSAFALGWRAVRGSRGFQRAVAIGCLGVLVHLTVHNMVDNLFVQGMYLHVAAVLGLLVFIDSQRAQS
jgi:O-antigen ligase